MLATLTRLSLFAVIRSKEVVNALSCIHILEIYELDSREITVDRVTDSAIQEKKKSQAWDQVSHSSPIFGSASITQGVSNFFNISKNVRPEIFPLLRRRTEKK